MALAERNNYPDRFSPTKFLDMAYKTPGTSENIVHNFLLDNLHKACSGLFPKGQVTSCHSDGIKVVDYGCGPVVANVISAAGIPNVSQIVMAEYTARSREAIQQWLDKDPSAFDWSLYFKYVVKTLEGKTEQQVAKREERMRSLLKVVSCDITLDQPIEKGYEGPYDIVICSLCLMSCSNSEDEYRAGVRKLSSIMKPGGLLLIYSTQKNPEDEDPFYIVGSHYFHDLKVTYELHTSALKEAGLSILSIDHLKLNEEAALSNISTFVFVCAEKKKS